MLTSMAASTASGFFRLGKPALPDRIEDELAVGLGRVTQDFVGSPRAERCLRPVLDAAARADARRPRAVRIVPARVVRRSPHGVPADGGRDPVWRLLAGRYGCGVCVRR